MRTYNSIKKVTAVEAGFNCMGKFGISDWEQPCRMVPRTEDTPTFFDANGVRIGAPKTWREVPAEEIDKWCEKTKTVLLRGLEPEPRGR